MVANQQQTFKNTSSDLMAEGRIMAYNAGPACFSETNVDAREYNTGQNTYAPCTIFQARTEPERTEVKCRSELDSTFLFPFQKVESDGK